MTTRRRLVVLIRKCLIIGREFRSFPNRDPVRSRYFPTNQSNCLMIDLWPLHQWQAFPIQLEACRDAGRFSTEIPERGKENNDNKETEMIYERFDDISMSPFERVPSSCRNGFYVSIYFATNARQM